MTLLLKTSLLLQCCCLLFSIQINARRVPLTGEDLVLDSLMPVNASSKFIRNRVERQSDSSEGSGQGGTPIESLPSWMGMERLQLEPVNEEAEEGKKSAAVEVQNDSVESGKSREEVESHDDGISAAENLHDSDEGSGASEKDEVEVPKTAAIVSDIDDQFKKEDGMKDVLEDLAGPASKQLETDDNNKQDNALSVLGVEDDLPVKTPDLHESIEEQEVEGSGTALGALPVSPIMENGNQEGDSDVTKEKKDNSEDDLVKKSETDGDEEKNKHEENNAAETETVKNGQASEEDHKELVPPVLDESEESAKENHEKTTEAAEVGINSVSQEDIDKSHEDEINSREKLEDVENTSSLINIENENEEMSENLTTPSLDSNTEEKDDGDTNMSSFTETYLSVKESERFGKMILLTNDTDSDEQINVGHATSQDSTELYTTTAVNADEKETEDEDKIPPKMPEIAEPSEKTPVTTTEEPEEVRVVESVSNSEVHAETTTEKEEEEPAIIELLPVSTEGSPTTEASSSTVEISASAEISSSTESSTESRFELGHDEIEFTESTTESVTEIPVTESSTLPETEESTTIDVILHGAALGENTIGLRERITNSEDRLESAGSIEEKSLGAYILIGLIAVCFLALVAFLVLRKRSKSQKARLDNNQERDPEKALLSNGKYKEESDENNIKNNEITPLVIKQNSQINKFEKNPNFSSPKNLNTSVNEKNIEKDNVLKSTQAIIEEDEDAKKALEEEKKPEEEIDGVDEEKKALMGENAPTEKVIVRTHLDQDSIPKKPVLVTRNGNGYHAVSQDPV